MARNKLQNVHGELSDLPRLRSVIVRKNQVRRLVSASDDSRVFQIKTSGIPTDIFRMKDLTIIDFSHNSLRDVPSNMEYAKCAIVLNLGHNNIESIPPQVSVCLKDYVCRYMLQIFNNLIDLNFLDLSYNKLETIPPLRRLTNLQVLKLSNNPLTQYQFMQSPRYAEGAGSNIIAITFSPNLRVLELRNTHRSLTNLPTSFDGMENLQVRFGYSKFHYSCDLGVGSGDERLTCCA